MCSSDLIDYKHAGYTIHPATREKPTTTFTFWWGRDSKAPDEFFDVSIAPQFDAKHPNMRALEIKGKSLDWSPEAGQGVVMNLTVENPNSFDVTFQANHVRIYN